MKRVSLLLSIVGIATAAMAQILSDYDKLEAKADRFVQLGEWNSAHAMYILMSEKRPEAIAPYSRAIVTSGKLANQQAQVDMLERTQQRGISLDSLFAEVHRFAFKIGESQEYEQFLRLVKQRQPWMARNINVRLLKYYDFRNDATNMVTTGNELLTATPDNTAYLMVVARGYMLQGDFENSVITYNRILTLDPDNYDSLIALGCYYATIWKASEGTRSQMSSIRDLAVKHLQKAYSLRPTPFVEETLKHLEKSR